MVSSELNPLLEAVGDGGDGGGVNGESFKLVPRLFDFRQIEFENGQNLKPGDPVSAKVSGFVKSVHDDGTVVVNITVVNSRAPLIIKTPRPIIRMDTSPSP